MDVATIAQIVSAVASVLYGIVFGVLYYLLLRLYRKMLDETREERTAKERPQVLVYADYGHLPDVDIVISNMSRGAAKEVTFDFSSRIESLDGFIITDLPYFQKGIGFLGPEGEIRCYWDSLENLVPMLKREGLTEGVIVTTRYKDLSGGSYEDRWTVNPLLYEGNRSVRQPDTSDLVGAVEKVSEKIDKATSGDDTHGERRRYGGG